MLDEFEYARAFDLLLEGLLKKGKRKRDSERIRDVCECACRVSTRAAFYLCSQDVEVKQSYINTQGRTHTHKEKTGVEKRRANCMYEWDIYVEERNEREKEDDKRAHAFRVVTRIR